MSLFISLLLLLGVSNSSNIADSLYLDVETAVSDTLYCSISNQFLEFSLGYYHSLDSLSNHLNWHNNYEPIVLNHFNKKDLAEIFFIFKNKRNLVTFRKNFSDGDGAYFVRFALIQDPNITLKTNAIKNEIQIGMKKAEFFKTIGIDNIESYYKYNTCVLVTPDCVFGYFVFKKDELSCIIIDIHDGVSAKNFLNRISDYPKYVDNLIDRDSY